MSKFKKKKEGADIAGTPAERFRGVLNEFEKRFPDPDPFSAMAVEGRYFAMLDEERKNMQNALELAIRSLDDWTCSVAPEECMEDRTKQAQTRLQEYGTLYYIATVVKQCNSALRR